MRAARATSYPPQHPPAPPVAGAAAFLPPLAGAAAFLPPLPLSAMGAGTSDCGRHGRGRGSAADLRFRAARRRPDPCGCLHLTARQLGALPHPEAYTAKVCTHMPQPKPGLASLTLRAMSCASTSPASDSEPLMSPAFTQGLFSRPCGAAPDRDPDQRCALPTGRRARRDKRAGCRAHLLLGRGGACARRGVAAHPLTQPGLPRLPAAKAGAARGQAEREDGHFGPGC